MADPKISISKTLVNEGGYSDNSYDSGGETYRGISRVNHPSWAGWKIIDGYKSHSDFPSVLDSDQTLQSLVIEEYRDGYWKPFYSQIVNQDVADKLFDLGILFGVGTAVRILQTVLLTTVDGVFGGGTLAAVNAVELKSILAAYKTAMVSHALGIVQANPQDKKFFSGWVRRINS